jgi:hypothetical protein
MTDPTTQQRSYPSCQAFSLLILSRNKLRILLKVLFVDVMQQLILLLTSFLLGCGFPAFLIGFYSIRIWEACLRSLSLSFVGSGSSGSGREKPRSKHKKDRKDRDRVRRRETGNKPGREKSASLFFLCDEDRDQVYPGTFIYFGRCSVP